MTTTDCRVCTVLMLLVLLTSCVSGPHLAYSSDVIELQKSGADSQALLQWVQDPSRTFDLTDSDIVDLVEAGVSEEVIEAMLERSKEHHEEGNAHEHEHGH